jgi:hypothetical protein
MIGPGGLLLVYSHLFAVPVLVLWAGLEKVNDLNLDVRNIFSGYILSTIGDALRSLGMDNNKLLQMRKKWNFFGQLDAACVLCLVF